MAARFGFFQQQLVKSVARGVDIHLMRPIAALDCRRKKLLLREAIDVLLAVGATAAVMADDIESTLSQPGQHDVIVATEEMVSLRLLARDVENLAYAILDRERAEGFLPL